MPAPQSIPAAAWVISVLLLGIGISIYTFVATHINATGGKVRTDSFGLSELLMSLVLAGTFGLLMISAILRQIKGDTGVKIESVVPSSLLFVVITIGILCFLRFVRHLRVSETFGINQTAPLMAIGWAAALLVAAFPLVSAANATTMLILKERFSNQPLVELFNGAARQGNHGAIAQIFFAGVIVAPCCEEFLFRGFFYGVWKRYLGPLGAGFLTCLLFAAFHTSLPALAGLFVLAVCLNLAYERTGSLLVPIGMHALFNFSSLLYLYVQARFPVIPVTS